MVKRIEAIVREEAAHRVVMALRDIAVMSVSTYKVYGRGRQPDQVSTWRGERYIVDLHPRMQVEVLVHELNVKRVVDAIIAAARTGWPGDGIIFILPVDSTARIH